MVRIGDTSLRVITEAREAEFTSTRLERDDEANREQAYSPGQRGAKRFH